MEAAAILYPLFALVGWTFLIAAYMVGAAVKALRAGLRVEYFRYGDGDEPPCYMRSAYQHYSNLFEMPVLFYVGGLLAYVSGHSGLLLVAVAWAYVGMRMIHSVLHLQNSNIPRRRDAYLVSTLLLVVMWGFLWFEVVTNG